MSNKLRTYIDEVSDELMNKVSWPSAAELQSSAIVVLVATIILSIIIFIMDISSNKVMELFYSLIHK
jgi:preprotein translocase subunit SecE